MKAAVCKVMAMNRLFKGIASPPAEWQVEVERQKAGRLAEDFRRLKVEKERVDRAKKASKTGRKDARANARVERQARIEKKLMQQNTQAQLLVENMEEALLKVPELRPPVAPELHPNELLQAKLVIHDLATSGLGEKVSEMAAKHAGPPVPKVPTGKVLHWDRAALNNRLSEAHCLAQPAGGVRTFYPQPNGLLMEPVYPLDDLQNQPWYPSKQWMKHEELEAETPEALQSPKANLEDSRVWL